MTDHPKQVEGLPTDAVMVARAGRPHGLRGELRMFPTSEQPDRLTGLTEVWLVPRDADGRGGRLAVRALRVHGRTVLVRLEGVQDRDAATSLTHAEVWGRSSELPARGEHEFGVDEVVGLSLHDENGLVGEIRGVIVGGAQDCFEVRHDGRMVLVPAVKDWLVEFDREGGRIVMRLPAGLLAADEPVGTK